MTRVPANELKDFARVCYEAMNVPAASADLLADTLVQADLWGHASHGVMRLFWYGRALRAVQRACHCLLMAIRRPKPFPPLMAKTASGR